jgi:hypothetical protein
VGLVLQGRQIWWNTEDMKNGKREDRDSTLNRIKFVSDIFRAGFLVEKLEDKSSVPS